MYAPQRERMDRMRRAKLLWAGLPILLLISASLTFAAKEPPARVIDPQVYRMMQYAFPYPAEPDHVSPGTARTPGTQQLGTSGPSASPGAAVGITWYEKQHNGSMGRMNETRTDTYSLAHFSWMFLPGRVIDEGRGVKYDNYNFSVEAFGTEVVLQPNDNYAGYVNLDVTNDNRAVIGAHNREPSDGHYDPTIYFDFAEGASFFALAIEIPQSVTGYAEQESDQEVVWPKFAYSEGASDTALHVFAQVSMPDAGDPQAIYYFRRVGADNNVTATWDYPPRVVDTVFDVSQSIEATDDGKVGLSWVANIPCAPGDPDTASCNTGVAPAQVNNDIYYQISNDYGATWQPRVNLTHNIGVTGEHYQPYADISLLFDTQGYLHVVWGAAYWNETGDVLLRNRIFHWSENMPYLRTAHAADWDQQVCNGGSWMLNASKMSISECNGRLYVLFVQFNDGAAGIYDDCADDGNPGFPAGSANGELYVTVSEDWGLTWDRARNLTNSRTPGCDSADGTGGPCESDNWPTMARYGTDVALAPGDNATDVVVPSGGADNGWYLDVQYINDHSAGAIVSGEGTWQQADVRWFRLACVEAFHEPVPHWQPSGIGFPAWTKMSHAYSRQVVMENLGNADLAYTVTAQEDPSAPAGVDPGWLAYSGFDGTLPFGLNNTETGNITVTPTGGNPAGIYVLTGRLIFDHNAPDSPDTFRISVIVADTLYPPEVDTVKTPALALVVNNSGAVGEEGEGGVNMDYTNPQDLAYEDCDSTADVYLFSGSPVIGYLRGSDTVVNFSLFGNDYYSPVGFFPSSNAESYDSVGCEVYKSVALTRDSSLAIQTTLFAPTTNTGDSVNFILKRLRVYPKDALAHSNVTIGEAVDWDIPSDSGSANGSDFNVTQKMIWQYGGEYHQDDTTECQNSDRRFGGIKFLQMKKGSTDLSGTAPYNAFTADNATWVYGNERGFVPGEIFTQMETRTGYSKFLSTHPDSTYVDLHSVMTFSNAMNLAATDTVTIWMALITVRDGTATDFATAAARAKTWWENHIVGRPTCTMRGDVNCDNKVIVSDLTYIVNFLFKGGSAPCLGGNGDVNCDGKITVGDLTWLVNCLFKYYPNCTTECCP